MSCDLSIVIVNYNVRHFLQQTLESVRRATTELNAEVWVVDNNSVDDSVEMVHREFPEVNVIANGDNPGFSKANNQAIQQSTGKYVLLLNPDTVLQEDTLISCFNFMEAHKEAGAMGAKMLDGSGQFLPESKRGFPSPWASFCKATGLSKLFKKSATFNQYHLGYLDENETHEIEVLCGAFMFMRKSVLDEVGILDEDFFMYGEDIDLSYRIVQAGHKIYYYPETQLIHFKGESTKKSTVNYVRVFYKAMIIFAKKHFSGRGAGFLIVLLNVAIFGRAAISLFRRVTERILLQLLDFAFIFVGLWGLKELWEIYYFHDPNYFPKQILFNLAIYSGIYVLSLAFHGVYRRHYKFGQIIRAIFVGLIVILALYGLVNSEYRFSRFLVVLSSILALIVVIAYRLVLQLATRGNLKIGQEEEKRIFVIGGGSEAQKAITLLEKSMRKHVIVGKVAPERGFDSSFHDSKWSKVAQLSKLEKANEFIFCVKDLEWNKVISLMNTLGPSIEYKMFGDDKMSILGSKSKNSSGELYTIQFQFSISKKSERVKKRLLDFLVGLFMLLFFFVFIWFQKSFAKYFSNAISLVLAEKTLVGYGESDTRLSELPKLKSSILDAIPTGIVDAELVHRANLLYAKDYNFWKDIEWFFRKISKLS